MKIHISDIDLIIMATTDLELAYFANLLTENIAEDIQYFTCTPFWSGEEPKKAIGFFIRKEKKHKCFK